MADKVTKTEAKYRPRPNKGDKCVGCSMFQQPRGCSAVGGTISPTGWCSYFEDKKGAASKPHPKKRVQHFEDGGSVEDPQYSQKWQDLPKSQNIEDRRGGGAWNSIADKAAQLTTGQHPAMGGGPRQQYQEWASNLMARGSPSADQGASFGHDWNVEIQNSVANDPGPGSMTSAPPEPQGNSNLSMEFGGKVPDWARVLEPGFEFGGDLDEDDEEESPTGGYQHEEAAPPPVHEEAPIQPSAADDDLVTGAAQPRQPATEGTPSETPETGGTPEPSRDAAIGHTFGRAAATGVGSIPGLVAGAAIGQAAIPIPVVGGLIGAAVGGGAMGWAVSKARDWAADMLGLDSPESRAADTKKLEGDAMGTAAEVAGSMVGASPFGVGKTIAQKIAERLISGGGNAAINAGMQAVTKGEIDPGEVAMSGAAGAALPGFNVLGRGPAKLGHMAGEAVANKIAPGRPNLDQPTAAEDIHKATDGTSEEPKTTRGSSQSPAPPNNDRAQDVATLAVVGDEGNKGRWAKGAREPGEAGATEGRIEPPVIAALKEALDGGRRELSNYVNDYGSQNDKVLSDFVNGQTLGKETTVYRGHETEHPHPEDKPFASSSENPDVAADVAGENSRVSKITVAHDAPAVRINDHIKDDTFSDEQEILLGKGKYTKTGDNEYTFAKADQATPEAEQTQVPPHGDPAIDEVMQHPEVQKALKAPNGDQFINVKTQDGKAYVKLPVAKLQQIGDAAEIAYVDRRAAELGGEATDQQKEEIHQKAAEIGQRVQEDLVRSVGADPEDFRAKLGITNEEQIRNEPTGPEITENRSSGTEPQPRSPVEIAEAMKAYGYAPSETAKLPPERIDQIMSRPPPGRTQNVGPAGARAQATSQTRTAAAQGAAGNVPGTAVGGNNPPGQPPISPPQGTQPWATPGSRRVPQAHQGQPPQPFGGGDLPKPYRNVDQQGMKWVATDLPYHEGSPGRGPARSLADRQKEKDNEYVKMAVNARNNFWRRAATDKLGLENISDAWDKGDFNALPKKDRDEWDRNYQPIVDATTQLRENMKDWYRQRGFSEDQIAKRVGYDTENGMMRVREDFQNMREWQALQNMDTILGQQTSRRPQYVDRIKPREFMALESDQTGERRLISIHNDGDGFSEWKNQRKIKTVDHGTFDRRVGEAWDGTKENPPSNQTYRLRDATMQEIEQHGLDANNRPLKYLRDPRASAYLQFMTHFRAAQDMQMIEGIPHDPRLKDLMVKAGDVGRMPDGWVRVNSDPFRTENWYADPALARVLDMYNRPGIQDDRFNGMRKWGRMMQNTMFWQNLKHPMNVVPHWFENAGFDLIPGNIKGNARILASIPLGVKEVISPGRITERLMDHPGTLMYQNTIADKTNRAIKAIGDAAMQTNMPQWQRLAAKAGVPVKVLLKGWWQLSRENTWALGDMMGLAAHIQNAMKVSGWHPLKGRFDIDKLSEDQIEDVINMTNKTVPPYRIPESQLGMPLLSTIQSEQGLFSFGPYHHAIENTFGNILKAVSPPGNGVDLKTRWDSVGKAFGLAVFMYLIHPLFDKIAKKVTGNEDATAWQAGPPAMLHLFSAFGEGSKEGIGAVQHLLMMNPLLKASVEAFYTNKDWKEDPVFEPQRIREAQEGDWRAIPKLAGQGVSHFARELVSPIGSAVRYMGSHVGPGAALRDDFFGFKQPHPSAEYWKNKTLEKQRSSAARRELKTKDPIEKFFNSLSHIGEGE